MKRWNVFVDGEKIGFVIAKNKAMAFSAAIKQYAGTPYKGDMTIELAPSFKAQA